MFVHPDLADVFAAMPARPTNPYADIEATRADFRALMAPLMPASDPRVTVEDDVVTGPDGNTIDVQILRPTSATGTLPAVLYIHGGGFAYGELDGPSPMAREICAEVGAVVVNVHYRLAPEHRFPAGIEDCYAALRWLADNAATLGVDPTRIGVAGASAGGCLTAALALLARDRGGPAIAHQCLLIPVLDDQVDAAITDRFDDPRIFNSAGLAHTWDTYLGPNRAAEVSPYAAPARATNLTGLPPAYVLTCGLDPLRDEGLTYARRLAEADVPVETKDIPGAWHFFEAYAPTSNLARHTTTHWQTAIHTALT
ncbi:alpha/beta hydrolase [Solihabitans fulvus]|uniref:Alpha/beta hydrolase n=1 Tax=Solihabitans fulvus TaxID=1892852 RepID=A0A5B2WQ24_9PSEU|nr:alpha/beta hydrolase [Solihabitans fulvus]KAA2252880.1 alpha/beta hydrolase [Solihabitans fulvus]